MSAVVSGVIGVIGAGFIGGELGRLWADRGYDVVFGSRDPHGEKLRALVARAPGSRAAALQDAADAAEVLLVALPGARAVEGVAALANLDGKVVIDATNRFPPGETSNAAAIAAAHPGARVVKAFNTVGGENYARPRRDDARATMLYATDHDDAAAVAVELIAALGFEPLRAGPLERAVDLERLAAAWVGLSRSLGRDFVWRVLR